MTWAFIAVAVTAITWREYKASGDTLRLFVGWRVLWIFCKWWHGARITGKDPIPEQGPVIMVSNHVSVTDPLFIQCASRRLISYLMAKEYYDIKWFQPIFRLSDSIPVARERHDSAATRAALRGLRRGKVIGIFPEGGINQHPERLRKPKLGVALIALRTKATVIPVFISHPNPTVSIIGGLLRRSPARLAFGDPVDLSCFYDQEADRAVLQQATDLMMESIERLRF